jgi:hypothetical protein
MNLNTPKNTTGYNIGKFGLTGTWLEAFSYGICTSSPWFKRDTAFENNKQCVSKITFPVINLFYHVFTLPVDIITLALLKPSRVEYKLLCIRNMLIEGKMAQDELKNMYNNYGRFLSPSLVNALTYTYVKSDMNPENIQRTYDSYLLNEINSQLVFISPLRYFWLTNNSMSITLLITGFIYNMSKLTTESTQNLPKPNPNYEYFKSKCSKYKIPLAILVLALNLQAISYRANIYLEDQSSTLKID